MEPHECKLDANDSTVGSELKEREREIPVIEEPRTEKRKKKKRKKFIFCFFAAVRYISYLGRPRNISLNKKWFPPLKPSSTVLNICSSILINNN
jgi:hypothetical protein